MIKFEVFDRKLNKIIDSSDFCNRTSGFVINANGELFKLEWIAYSGYQLTNTEDLLYKGEQRYSYKVL